MANPQHLPNINATDLIQALARAHSHAVANAPVRDFSATKRSAYSDGVTFVVQFIQDYAATAEQLQELALEVEADTFAGVDPFLED